MSRAAIAKKATGDNVFMQVVIAADTKQLWRLAIFRDGGDEVVSRDPDLM